MPLAPYSESPVNWNLARNGRTYRAFNSGLVTWHGLTVHTECVNCYLRESAIKLFHLWVQNRKICCKTRHKISHIYHPYIACLSSNKISNSSGNEIFIIKTTTIFTLKKNKQFTNCTSKVIIHQQICYKTRYIMSHQLINNHVSKS